MIDEIKSNFNNGMMIDLVCKDPNGFVGFCVCDDMDSCLCNHSFNNKVLEKGRLIVTRIDNERLFFSDGLFINVDELKYFVPVYREIDIEEVLSCALMLLGNETFIRCDDIEIASDTLDSYCSYKINPEKIYEEFVIELESDLEKIDVYKSPIIEFTNGTIGEISTSFDNQIFAVYIDGYWVDVGYPLMKGSKIKQKKKI